MNDWYPLDGDPAPGDPGQIRFGVDTLVRSERAVRDVDDALRRVARGTFDAEWKGESAEAMRKVLDSFRYDLEPIADSFADVAHAMKRYAGELEELQARARQALARAKAADARAQAAAGEQKSATAELRRQQQALANSKRAETGHALTSGVQNVVDPSAAAANAQEADRLARQTRSLQGSQAAAQQAVTRIQGALDAARADLAGARRASVSIFEDWDAVSNRTADQVERALATQLKNKSNLEKFGRKVAGELGDIARFMVDPLHNISVLRKWIDRIHEVLGYLAFAIAIAIVVVVVIGSGPLGALLVASLLVAGAAFATSMTKLQLDTLLYNTNYKEGGETVVTKGDLVDDAVDVGADAVGVVTAAAGVAAGPAEAGVGSFGKRYVREVGKEVIKKSVEDVGTDVLKEEIKVHVDPVKIPQIRHCVRIPRSYVIHHHDRPAVPSYSPGDRLPGERIHAERLPRPSTGPGSGPVSVGTAGSGVHPDGAGARGGKVS